MQLIFDNIVASIIASTVLLIMVVSHHRNQVATVESTAFYMLQQQMMDWTGTIRRDMQNASEFLDVVETDSSFEFRAQTATNDTTKRLIEYRRKWVSQRTRDTTTVQLYQIERYVDGDPAGGSIGSIAFWNLQALNEDRQPVADPDDAVAIRVTLGVVPPIEVRAIEGKDFQATRWQATFRPQLMRDNAL